MKDLIAKLQMDANCAMGAIWLHIEAREARIAELEAELAKLRAGAQVVAEPVAQHPILYVRKRDMEGTFVGDLVYAYKSACGDWNIPYCAAPLPAATALQAPVREVPRWQPIETAPKDGTHILLWWGEQARLGWWLDNSHTRTPWAGWKVPSLQVVPFGCQPTHWMPLPAAPVQPEGE